MEFQSSGPFEVQRSPIDGSFAKETPSSNWGCSTSVWFVGGSTFLPGTILLGVLLRVDGRTVTLACLFVALITGLAAWMADIAARRLAMKHYRMDAAGIAGVAWGGIRSIEDGSMVDGREVSNALILETDAGYLAFPIVTQRGAEDLAVALRRHEAYAGKRRQTE